MDNLPSSNNLIDTAQTIIVPPTQSTQTPKKQLSKPLIIISIIIILVTLIGGIYLLSTRSNPPPIPKQSYAPSSTPNSSEQTQKNTQTSIYKNNYGEYSIEVPSNLTADSCASKNINLSCDSFILKNTSYLLITMQVSATTSSNLLNTNFNIPKINNYNNAILKKDGSTESISFNNNLVHYEFTLDLASASESKANVSDIEKAYLEMAKSISFLSISSSCVYPTLSPLTDFPYNFSLSNYHLSNDLTKISSYFPSTLTDNNTVFSQNTKYVEFIVSYARAGIPFSQTQQFLNSVSAVNSVKTPGIMDQDQTGTDLWHVNCTNTQEDSFNYQQPFYIGDTSKDPYAVSIYSPIIENSIINNLSWNLNLLKEDRNTVYIKRGNMWQQYIAQGYFVTQAK